MHLPLSGARAGVVLERVLMRRLVGTSEATYAHDGRSGDIDLLLWPVNFSLAYVGYAVLDPFVAYGVEAGLRYSDPAAIKARLHATAQQWAAALGDIARARGMTEIAEAAGITREALYKALRPDSAPRFDTVSRVCAALGVRLVAQPVNPRRRVSGASWTRGDEGYTIGISRSYCRPLIVRPRNVYGG